MTIAAFSSAELEQVLVVRAVGVAFPLGGAQRVVEGPLRPEAAW